ncbi:MAG: Ca2+-dependent phosphoinositide-specific phospholipase C [Pseudomonadota bacterium]
MLYRLLVILLGTVLAVCAWADTLRINQIQFVGSHNSYKKAMSLHHVALLKLTNPEAARSLDYEHLPIAEQLELGMRVLEIDLFYLPDVQQFKVGHVQVIDMNSHCDFLNDCIDQIKAWSEDNPRHIPIWLMFNLKDQKIESLPDPAPFNRDTLELLDTQFEHLLGPRLIRPSDVVDLNWPTLDASRGKFLLLLDEGGTKRESYLTLEQRVMFTNGPAGDPNAQILVLNDPHQSFGQIQNLVRQGYMVRTRADADTVEARAGDVSRRDAAFASGAQAVSTDYYLPSEHFGTHYQVTLPNSVRCNPVNGPEDCPLD